MKHLAARLGSLMLPIAMSMNMVACGGDGKDGATGEQGEQGDQGKQGDQGEQGDRGPKGDPGKPGADGTDGTDGTDGADGADGAEGPAGADGADGQDGISTAVLSGSVTNGSDDSTLAGAVLSFDPASPDGDVAADDDGAYTVTLPIGVYTVTATADGFTEQAQTVSLVAGNDVALDIELVPESPVAIAAEGATGEPGATVSLSASATVYDGSTGTEYSWEQISGPPVTISGEDTATPDVTLPSAATSIEAIIESLQVPDRLMVLGVNPHALELGEIAVLELTVTTSSGSYTQEVEVTSELGLAVTTSLENIPRGVPQLLQAKEAASYSWSVTSAPAGSSPALEYPTTRWPIFTPDLSGSYELTESTSGGTLTLIAGTWVGAIQELGSDGRPVAKELCVGCHNGGLAPDMFTDWRQTGHAEIFTQNIDNPDGHWSESCAMCHTVGYDVGENGGFDDKMAEEGWTVPHGAVGNYEAMFADYPETASLANVQCESCHGPNGTAAHATQNEKRISIAAEVCGSCHGEPLRHGRFQQWQESGHSNYELAIEEATVESRGATASHCGRCHSSQGFMAWIEQDDMTLRIQGAEGDATVEELTAMGLTEDAVHPQTCTTCHDPHKQGTTSGEPNTATVRISGDTKMLPAGFKATGVGHGALCISCHNTRNGAHNDTVGDPTSFSAPHVAAQGDVLMGQNAYFVTAGQRGAHSYINNTCTNCHMVATPPPALLSYNQTGTNHSFTADMSICGNCHGDFDGGTLQAATSASLADLAAAIAAAAEEVLSGTETIHVRAYDAAADLYSSAAAADANVVLDLTANPLTHVEVTEGHGQGELHLTLTSPISIAWSDGTSTTTDSFGVQLQSFYADDGLGAQGVQVFSLTGNMVRAVWNLLLLEGDGSLGVHNPSFYNLVINATMAQDLTL